MQMDPRIPPSAPGFFTARIEMRMNPTVGSAANSDGEYSALVVVPNRRRFTQDSAEILALAYDRGLLPRGNAPDGMWERLDDGTIEVRIPWMLLNITDPSQRRVLDNRGPKDPAGLGTSTVSGIRIAVRATDGAGTVRTWPSAASGNSQVATFTWATWEEPEWSVRKRSVYDEMRATFETLRTPVIR
jgi:hypothetical protein